MSLIIYPPESPVFAHIFNCPIRYYGLIMALSFFAGIFLVYHLLKKKVSAQDAEIFFDCAPLIIFVSIIGARLFYVIADYKFYFKAPFEIIMINHGGLSIFGAIFFGLVSLFVLSKIKKFNFLSHLDVFAAVFPLCQAIGRFGNYFNQEAYGAPHDGLLKLYVDEQYRNPAFFNIEYYHPAFLYESVLNFGLFVVLLFIFLKRKNLKSGTISALYLIFYSIIRFVVEGYRIDSVLNLLNIPVARIISIITFILGITLLFIINKRQEN